MKILTQKRKEKISKILSVYEVSLLASMSVCMKIWQASTVDGIWI